VAEAPPRDLRPLFDPRSVAVVGASADPAKWGNWLARRALRGESRRRVHLVNRTGAEVLGRRTFRSLAELPEPPELVVVAVPAAGFEQAVDDALAAGARALVGITAGLGESGEEAAARERALVRRVRGAGAVLLGPNCLGLSDTGSGFDLANDLPAGDIGLVSQSGNLALELGLLAAPHGLGFSRFVSIGNGADLDAAELVTALAEHPQTRRIGLYVEDFRDGRALVAAVRRAALAGKPVVLLTVGRTEASARAARSHTGALASPDAVVDAACRAAGMHRVATPGEMIDVLAGLGAPRLRGRRVAVLADGGGHGAIAADVLAARGLEVPPLSAALRARLAADLPPAAGVANPVDLAGAGEADFGSYARMARSLLESGEVDAVLLTGYFGGYSQFSEAGRERETAVGAELAAAARASGRTLVAQSMYPASPPAAALRAGGVPVLARVESAARALAALAEPGPAPEPPPPPPQRPAAPVAGYFAARELLAEADVPVVDALPAAGAGEAVAAAGRLGYPVVLKALGELHKSDRGGVLVGIRNADELVRAVARLGRELAPSGFSVERTAPVANGVELVVGARRDRAFGPVVLVGAGGVHAETLADTAVALAPLGAGEAAAMLRRLRAWPLIAGARGRPPLDAAAAAAAIEALGRLIAARPDIADVEANPLLLLPAGVLALDARVIVAAPG
jgi:acyl-CoA synthetase (NDP forming)